MANTFTKETKKDANGKETVRYKQGENYVEGTKVPEAVRTALNNVKEGTEVDELGDVFNPETDTDESEDEQLPTTPPKSADDDDDEDDDDEEEDESDTTSKKATPAATPAKQRRGRKAAGTDDGSGEEGMGFPRVEGKTVDIFDGVTPHTHVKPVAGLMVPLSARNFAEKSDTEIMQQLQKMGKIS